MRIGRNFGRIETVQNPKKRLPSPISQSLRERTAGARSDPLASQNDQGEKDGIVCRPALYSKAATPTTAAAMAPKPLAMRLVAAPVVWLVAPALVVDELPPEVEEGPEVEEPPEALELELPWVAPQSGWGRAVTPMALQTATAYSFVSIGFAQYRSGLGLGAVFWGRGKNTLYVCFTASVGHATCAFVCEVLRFADTCWAINLSDTTFWTRGEIEKYAHIFDQRRILSVGGQ
jgi:hypothetical protein